MATIKGTTIAKKTGGNQQGVWSEVSEEEKPPKVKYLREDEDLAQCVDNTLDDIFGKPHGPSRQRVSSTRRHSSTSRSRSPEHGTRPRVSSSSEDVKKSRCTSTRSDGKVPSRGVVTGGTLSTIQTARRIHLPSPSPIFA
ncbi:hypothetical protein Bbelb_026150 [Branchiostoma belcheri]|nr:hypothetical protein Bbelb_026150 [Branchiostoma belcheri]